MNFRALLTRNSHRSRKHKDPPKHDFWYPPLRWAFEPGCEILLGMIISATYVYICIYIYNL